MRSRILTTVGDSTSQKFLMIGQISRKDQESGKGRIGVVFLDFATLDRRKCGDGDFEEWTARSSTHECLMGHKVRLSRRGSARLLTGLQQTYRRRRQDADCYVGDKFHDPVAQEQPCPCTDEDYEWYACALTPTTRD